MLPISCHNLFDLVKERHTQNDPSMVFNGLCQTWWQPTGPPSLSQQIRDTVSAWAESLHTIYCEEGARGETWELASPWHRRNPNRPLKSENLIHPTWQKQTGVKFQMTTCSTSVFPGRTRHELCRASLGSMRIYTSRGLFTVLTKPPVTQAERLNWVCSGLWCAVLQGLFKKLFRIFFFFLES